MTKKAARAQSIRKLTDTDQAQLSASEGWATTHPALDPRNADVAGARLDDALASFTRDQADSLRSYLRVRVAEYLARERSSREAMSTAQEIEVAKETLSVIGELRLRLECMPERILASTEAAFFAKRRELPNDFLLQIDRDLDELQHAIASGVDELNDLPPARGAKKKVARDDLVRDVLREVERLQPTATKDRIGEIAHALLAALDVPIPDDALELRRIAVKGKN